MTKHTILFLAANLVGTGPFGFSREARAIQVELERSGHRDQFELVTRWAAESLDLRRELRKLKPTTWVAQERPHARALYDAWLERSSRLGHTNASDRSTIPRG